MADQINDPIKDSYNVFVRNGYNGTFEEFKELIKSTPEALTDSFNMYSKSVGYKGTLDDYKSMLGISKKKEDTALLPGLGLSGYASPVAPDVKSSKPIMPFDKDYPITKGIVPKYVDEQLSTITPDFISKSEDYALPQLQNKFGPLGFKFNKGSDGSIIATSPDNKEEIEVSFDSFLGLGKNEEAAKLDTFIRKHASNIPNIKDLESEYIGEKRKYNTSKDVEDVTNRYVKKVNDFRANIDSLVKERNTIDDQIDEQISAPLAAIFGEFNETENERKARFLKIAELRKRKSEIESRLSRITSSEEFINGVNELEAEGEAIKKSVGEYTIMRSKQGTKLGLLKNSFLTGFGRQGAGAASYAIDNFITPIAMSLSSESTIIQEYKLAANQLGKKSPESTEDFKKWLESLPKLERDEIENKAKDNISKGLKYGNLDEKGNRVGGFVDDTRRGLATLFGSEDVTPEYEDLKKAEFWMGSIAGVTESIPAMIGGGGTAGFAQRAAQMFLSTGDYVTEEMSKDPSFANISEKEKEMIIAPYAIGSAVLESIGIRNVLASKGVLNNLIYRSLNKTGAGVSAKSFAEFIKNDIKSGLARGTLTIVGGALAEAETGAAQRLLEISIKDIYNESKDKEMFKNLPQTFTEIVKDVSYSAAQEAVGGGVIGMIPAVAAAYRKRGFQGMSDKDFMFLEAAANDVKIEDAFKATLRAKVASSEISMEDARQTLNDYRNAVGLFNSLPENLSIKDKKEAMNLLRERRDLERQAEGKDPALVAPITERIKNINESLTKLSQNAIQEQAANEGVLRQEGPKVGLQEVVQGDQGARIEGAQQGQEQTAAAPAQITGLSISDPEVDTRVTDEKQKGVLSFARKAVSAISSIMPGVEFVVHDNSDSYTAAVAQRLGKESKEVAGTSGYFTYDVDGSVRIDIDLTRANSRTVAHEVAHAVLYKKFNDDFTLYKDFRDRLSGVISSMAPQDFVTEKGELTTVKKQLEDFVSRYEKQGENVKADEFITELSAMLANNEAKISTSGWNKISTFIGDFVSKITGGKVNLFEGAKTTRDVVDFFNSMSKAIAAGEDVSGINFARRGGQAPATGQVAQGVEGKASISDENKYKPLPGAPTKAKDIAGPDPKLVSVAEQYAKENGIDFKRQGEYVEIDEAFSKRIAQAFEDMKHDPSNEKVKEAYSDLIRQTKDQYDALIKAGYEFSFFDSKTDPYKGNPSDAMRDLRSNKKMAVYGTYDGYGTEGITAKEQAENPLLEDTGLRWKDQNGVEKPVTANDLFRAVHDAFGHGLEGAGFRARGEENAWQAHVRLFQGPAVGAITTETRGQNSWLNFGPYGEKNRTAKLEDTVFGEQKIGLMPEWTWTERRAPDYQAQAEIKPEVKGKASVLSDYRDNKRFKFSDLKYPDTVLGKVKEGKDINTAISFYEKIVRVFNKLFDRDVKVYSEKNKNNFGVTVEYETGLKPKYFSYPTSKMGEHVVVDKIDKFTPLTSLRHELIHEMLVKNITDKFERINEMDQSAVSESIENVQRNRAYNYSLEDVFFERVVENIERLPDNKDTFPIETYAQDVVNRLVSELNNESPSKEEVDAKLNELLDGSNPWLKKNLTDAIGKADFSRPLKESIDKIGKYFSDRFTVSKDIFPKDLQEKIFKFTEIFNDEYQGVLTRLKSTEKTKPAAKGKASRTAPLITDKKILSQMTEDNDGNFLFYHISPNKITGKIDPKFFGRNLRTGRDERPGIGISMYYTRPDRADVSGQYRYVAAIPKENVYPFNEDPLNLYDKAEAEFNKMFPGQAFDPNKQVAFISREAEKLGYQMTVAKWGDGLRAQTTKAIKPEWLERPNGNKVEVNEKFKDFKANAKTAVKGKASRTAVEETAKALEDIDEGVIEKLFENIKDFSFVYRGVGKIDERKYKYYTQSKKYAQWFARANKGTVGFFAIPIDQVADLTDLGNRVSFIEVEKKLTQLGLPIPEFVKGNIKDGYGSFKFNLWEIVEGLLDNTSIKGLKIKENNPEAKNLGIVTSFVINGIQPKAPTAVIAEAYQQAKEDGSNPELVKDVEDAIGAKPEVKGKASRLAPENEVSEKTLPGYDSLLSGIAKYVSNAISRGDAKADIIRTAVDIAQSSPIYESANDVQREQIVREARKAAGASQKSSPSVSRLFGIAKDVKSITMTEYALLKKQMADLNRGAKDMKKAWLESSRELGKYVRDMAGKGYITPKQAAAVVKKFSGVNVLSQKSIDKFVDYMQMVFDNAEYAEKISSIRTMLPNARKNLGTKIGIADGLADGLARMLSINPLLIPETVLDTYQSVVKMMSERKAVLNLRDIQDVTQDVSGVLDAVELEQSSIPSLKDLFDDYVDKVLNQDGSINFAETINKMVKNNNISQETADIMKKYKSEIMPSPAAAEKTQAEIDAEKTVLANMISSSTVNADRLPTRDERELARKISELVKNTKLERLSLDQLNNLLSVIDNINNGYVPHIAQMLAERMESTESGTKLSKVPALVKPNVLKVAYAKIKSLLANDSAMVTLIKRNSLGYIDQVFGDYKTKTLFNSVLKGVAQAQAKFDSYVSQLNERINKAENDVLRSHGYNHNEALMSKFKMMAYMLQNEYDSNPNNKQVNSAASYIKKTIDHILFNKSTFGERDAKMLQQILDKYSDQNTGQIDAAALYSSFNEAEKRAISEIRNINNDLTEKAVFTAAVIRGEKINPLNNYVHLNVLHEFRPEESTTGPAFVQSFSNSLRPSTKAKSLIERTPGAKPLNFDVFASVSRGARFVYMDYHMTPSIRTARKTIAFAKKQMKENGASRKEIEIINAIDESFETAVENVLVNNFSSSSFADDVINFMSKQGYRAVLASIPRFAAELTSNLSMVAFFPKDFSSGVGLSKLSYSTQGIDIMRNVGSTQTKRVFPSNTISGRLVDSQLLEQASGSKGGRAKSDIANKLTQIYNRSLKKYTNVVGLTADVLISTPDKLVIRPMWFGTFANEFKKISGVDADMDKIAENNEQYMMQNKKAIDAARDKADDRSVFVGATDNSFMGVLKGVSGKDQSVAVKLFNQFNGFMSRFMINEFTTARTAIHAAVGNGMISRKEGVALLAGVTTRMTLYTMLGQMLSNAMVGMFVEDEEEDEKSFDKKVYQSIASTMTSLLLGRDFGNLTRGAVNYGVEAMNEEYLDFLREGEYDPYKDAIQYSFIPPERKGQGRQFEDLITNLMGPLGPSAKTGSLMYKTYFGPDKKEADAIERQEDVKNTRIPLEIFGNLGMVPLYKDIRKIALKEMYKGLNDKKSKDSDDPSKNYLKKNYPDLYKDIYESNGSYKEAEEAKKMVEDEKKRIKKEIKDMGY